MMNKKTILRLLVLVVLLSAIIWVGVEYREQLELRKLQAYLDSFGIWAPLVFMGIYIAATVLFLPGAILTITGGLLFGAFWGTIYNISSAVIGATLAFLIARYVASDWVAAKAGGKLKQLITGVEEEGWRFVAVVRLIPLFPFNLLNYALGLTKIRVLAYVLASAIFMLPGTFAYTYIGSLGETFIYGEARDIVTQVSIAIGLLILLAFLPWFIKRLRKQKQ